MAFKKIEYSVNGGVASIVLNSPKNLNAFDEDMIDDVTAALDQCAADAAVKVVVISGAGKGFSAGGDLNMLSSGTVDFGSEIQKAGQIALKLRTLPKPIIAALHGPVAGAGANIALGCDFRIASEDAKFVQAFVNIGLVPDAGGLYLLTRVLGVARATDLTMSGRPVDAQEALAIGMVNKVVPREALEEQVAKFAARMAAGPALAYAGIKALVFESEFKDFETYLKQEEAHQVRCGGSQDFKEGVAAFMGKRKPNFQGK